MTFGYQLEYGSTSAQPALFCAVFNVCVAADRDRLSQFRRLGVASWRVTRNHADDVFNPTTGSVLSLDLRHASRFVGTDASLQFNKAVGDASWYQSIGSGNVLVARLRLGLVGGMGGSVAGASQFIPPQERLYAGGATTVRGFNQNELGPTVYVMDATRLAAAYDTVTENGQVYFRTHLSTQTLRIVPTGGNAIAVGNLEARLRSPVLPQLVQLVLFTDAGDVWTRGQSAGSRLRVTPGAGIRVFSFVGPIRVDVGYNGYPRPDGPAYFDASTLPSSRASGVAPLYCVSPGNRLPVLLDPDGAPATQATGTCPATYAYPSSDRFLKRLKLHFSIGQAF
jgi:outer membrane protein assembly factor BamA